MSPNHQGDASPPPARTLVGIVLVVATFAGVYMFGPSLLGRRPNSVAKIEDENEKLRQQVQELEAKQQELDAEQLMELENQQVSRSRLIELDAVGKLAEEKLSSFEQQAKHWTQTTEALASDERGRKIAANPQNLETYHALMQSKLPSPILIAANQDKLSALLLPIRKALETENPLYVPAESTVSAIVEISAEAEVGASAYKKANISLDAILDAVGSDAEIGTETLDIALQNIERRWAAEQNARIAKEVARVREEETARLEELKKRNAVEVANAAREAEEEKAKHDLERIEAQKAAARSAQEIELARIQAETDRKQLLEDFERDLPAIRKYLAPFLQEAYSQPGRYQAMEVSSEKKPMSLQAIQATGGLDDSIDGLRALHLSATKLTDRNSGVFSEQYNEYSVYKEKYIATSKTAQALLLKYGDLLVEKQLLSP